MSTPESQRLRDQIRAGVLGPDVYPDAWRDAIARVYELEEAAEKGESDGADEDHGA